MTFALQADIDGALKRLGHYRVVRAQEQVEDGTPDGLRGSHLLALGMRETWGRNIQGGARQIDGHWVPETDPARMDVGWLQISRRFHPDALGKMPGVRVGTWAPVVVGKTALDGGFVPRFTDSLRFTAREMRASMSYARNHGVPERDLIRFAVAAHNAGSGGALAGWHAGDMDSRTASGDYSAWVLDAAVKVADFLRRHPNWIYHP